MKKKTEEETDVQGGAETKKPTQIEVFGAVEPLANGLYEPNMLPKDFLKIINNPDPVERKHVRQEWRKKLNVKTEVREKYPKYKISVEDWVKNFKGRCWYANQHGYVMSYNNGKWAILSPKPIEANHDHTYTADSMSQRVKAVGRAIYRSVFKDTKNMIPPINVKWEKHNYEGEVRKPRCKLRLDYVFE